MGLKLGGVSFIVLIYYQRLRLLSRKKRRAMKKNPLPSTVNQLTGNLGGNNLTPSPAAHVYVRQMFGVVKDLTNTLRQRGDGLVDSVIMCHLFDSLPWHDAC